MRISLENAVSLILKATVLALGFPAPVLAQNNPIPQIVGPVHPDAVAPGSGAFTLSVYGANFVPGSTVNWSYQPRITTYISAHELQAQILSTDVAKNTVGYISVTNPAPGGGTSSSSWAQVEVHMAVSSMTFAPPIQYQFGDWMMSAADFNHDGLLDLLGQYSGSFLELDLGKTGGRFHPQSILSRSYLESTQFGYGDFNGDGNLDVALVNGVIFGQDPTHVTVRLGDGKGSFSPGPTLTSYAGGLGWDMAIGDFNRDGKLDLVTRGNSTFSVFLGNGDGSFQRPANYPYTMAEAMVVGDFNGDGKLDLAFLESGKTLSLWFLPGNGDGTFGGLQTIGSFAGGSGCGLSFQLDLQVGDFNGDGKPDLAFCNQSQIGVLLGNGDGTFQSPSYYTVDPTGLGLFTFGIGDINSDAKQDLIASTFPLSANFQFVDFLGNGDGTFQAEQTIVSSSSTPAGEIGVTVGDFNADGLLDVIFVDGDRGMYVFLQ